MARLLAALMIVQWLGGGVNSPAAAQEGAAAGTLPADEGRDEVQVLCSGCHSMRLVTQQAMNRKRWDKTLDWMVDKQGMPEPDPKTRELVLDYLAEHFGADDRRPQPGLSPFNRVQPLQPRTR